jgi:hypothetical protein
MSPTGRSSRRREYFEYDPRTGRLRAEGFFTGLAYLVVSVAIAWSIIRYGPSIGPIVAKVPSPWR